jgi:hypothetical protein
MRPDSDLCQSLRQTAERIGVQAEIRTHSWSGSNSVRAREGAAQALVEQLKEDFNRFPTASHFLIAHSHGGNIVLDAARTADVGAQISGIVAMSAPFVSCRRSGITTAGGLLAVIVSGILLWLFLGFSLWVVGWVGGQAFSHISSGWILLPVSMLLTLIQISLFWNIMTGLFKIPFEAFDWARDLIFDWQDSVLERFDRHLKQPIPMFCVRFRMDEALTALMVSRLIVKPVRFLTLLASWAAGIGGVLLLLVLFGFIVGSFIQIIGIDIIGYVKMVGMVALPMLALGFFLGVLSLLAWGILGYVMGSMTLGHWGGFSDQLLVDFRITGTPEGANSTSKVFSPFRWRRTLLHSLTYGDRSALAAICEWIAARMCEDGKTGGRLISEINR